MVSFRSKLLVLGLMLVAMVLITGCAAETETEIKHGWFYDYWWNGGPLARFVELPLSIVIMALAITFFIKYRRSTLMPTEEMQRIVQLLEARQYRAAIEETARSTSLVGYALNKAMALAPMGYLVMERALEDAVDERAASLSSKLEPLNIIGNVGPLIGLLGTVLGMISMFITISLKSGGQVSPTELAAGISEALVCTAWGLTIAIPGLAIYGVLRNRVEGFANEAAVRGQEVLGIFRAGATGASGKPTNAPATAGAPRVAGAAPVVE